jgi:hypothetical protein
MMRRNTIVGSVLLALSIVVAVAMLPDIVRYMKTRANVSGQPAPNHNRALSAAAGHAAQV